MTEPKTRETVRRDELVTKECPQCRGTFEGLRRQIYCTIPCANKASYKRNKDKRNAARRGRYQRQRGNRNAATEG